jgi:hypothetical protein
VWVSAEVNFALARLARRYAVSKRQMLEQLIARADDAIVRELDPDTPQWDSYFNVARQLSGVPG